MLDWNVLCADFTGYLDGIIADHDIPLRVYKSLKIKPINYFSAACLQQCLRALTLLVGWQERHPACKKTWLVDLHMAQLMPLPLTDSFFSKIQIGFTFLVPDHPGSPEKEPLNGCVCVCVCVCVRACVCVCCHQQCSVLFVGGKTVDWNFTFRWQNYCELSPMRNAGYNDVDAW